MRRPKPFGALLRGTAAYALGPLVGLATAPIVARSLGVEGRGQLAAILQPLSVADAFAAFGLPAACTYFVARGASPETVLKKALPMVLGSALITYGALGTYAATVAKNQDLGLSTLLALWTSTILGAGIAVARGALAGRRQWRLLDAERSGIALSRLASIALVAGLGASSAVMFAAAPIGAGLLVSASVLVVGRRHLVDGTERSTVSSQTSSRQIALYAGSASVATIAFAANSRLDQALLPAVSDARSNGLYAVAATVAELALIVGAVAQRKITSDLASGEDAATVGRDIRWAALMSTLVTIVTIAAIAPLTPLIFGSDFSDSQRLVQVLAVGALGTNALMVTHAVNAGVGRPSLSAAPVAVSVIGVVIYVFLARGDVSVNTLAWVVSGSQIAGAVVASAIARRSWHSRAANQHSHDSRTALVPPPP